MDMHRLRVVGFDTSLSGGDGKENVAELEESKQEEQKAVPPGCQEGEPKEVRVNRLRSLDVSTQPGSSFTRHSKSEEFKVTSKGTLKNKGVKNNSSLEDITQSVRVGSRASQRKRLFKIFSRKPSHNRKSSRNRKSSTVSQITEQQKIMEQKLGVRQIAEQQRIKEQNADVKVLFTRETPSFIRHSRSRKRNINSSRKSRESNSHQDVFGFRKNRLVVPYQYQMSCHYLNIDKLPFKKLRKGFHRKQKVNKVVTNAPQPEKEDRYKHHAMRILDSGFRTSVEKNRPSSIYYNLSTHSRRPPQFLRQDIINEKRDENVAVTSASLLSLNKCCCDAGCGPSKPQLDASTRHPPSINQDEPSIMCKPCLRHPKPQSTTYPSSTGNKSRHVPCNKCQNKHNGETVINCKPGVLSGFLQNITTFQTRSGSPAKICIKYAFFGLLIVVWSPCLLAVVLAWIIMCPVRLTDALTKDKSKKQIPFVTSFMKRFRKKYPGSEYQRMCCNRSPRQNNKNLMSSVASWYARTAHTFVNSVNTVLSTLKIRNSTPSCFGSSFTKPRPNPKKRYTLFYADNRGWMMKPVRHRNVRSSRVVQNMRCEGNPKFWTNQNMTNGRGLKTSPLERPRQQYSPAGDGSSDLPNEAKDYSRLYSGKRFGSSARKTTPVSAMFVQPQFQQVNIPQKNVCSSRNFRCNLDQYKNVNNGNFNNLNLTRLPNFVMYPPIGPQYPPEYMRHNLGQQAINNSNSNPNGLNYLRVGGLPHHVTSYHPNTFKYGIQPYGMMLGYPSGTNHPVVITNKTPFKAHDIGLAGKKLNLSQNCNENFKKILKQYFRNATTSNFHSKTGKKDTNKNVSINKEELVRHLYDTLRNKLNMSKEQADIKKVALNCPCKPKRDTNVADRKSTNTHRSIVSKHKTYKISSTGKEPVRMRNRRISTEFTHSVLTKNENTSTYKIYYENKSQNISKHPDVKKNESNLANKMQSPSNKILSRKINNHQVSSISLKSANGNENIRLTCICNGDLLCRCQCRAKSRTNMREFISQKSSPIKTSVKNQLTETIRTFESHTTSFTREKTMKSNFEYQDNIAKKVPEKLYLNHLSPNRYKVGLHKCRKQMDVQKENQPLLYKGHEKRYCKFIKTSTPKYRGRETEQNEYGEASEKGTSSFKILETFKRQIYETVPENQAYLLKIPERYTEQVQCGDGFEKEVRPLKMSGIYKVQVDRGTVHEDECCCESLGECCEECCCEDEEASTTNNHKQVVSGSSGKKVSTSKISKNHQAKVKRSHIRDIEDKNYHNNYKGRNIKNGYEPKNAATTPNSSKNSQEKVESRHEPATKKIKSSDTHKGRIYSGHGPNNESTVSETSENNSHKQLKTGYGPEKEKNKSRNTNGGLVDTGHRVDNKTIVPNKTETQRELVNTASGPDKEVILPKKREISAEQVQSRRTKPENVMGTSEKPILVDSDQPDKDSSPKEKPKVQKSATYKEKVECGCGPDKISYEKPVMCTCGTEVTQSFPKGTRKPATYKGKVNCGCGPDKTSNEESDAKESLSKRTIGFFKGRKQKTVECECDLEESPIKKSKKVKSTKKPCCPCTSQKPCLPCTDYKPVHDKYIKHDQTTNTKRKEMVEFGSGTKPIVTLDKGIQRQPLISEIGTSVTPPPKTKHAGTWKNKIINQKKAILSKLSDGCTIWSPKPSKVECGCGPEQKFVKTKDQSTTTSDWINKVVKQQKQFIKKILSPKEDKMIQHPAKPLTKKVNKIIQKTGNKQPIVVKRPKNKIGVAVPCPCADKAVQYRGIHMSKKVDKAVQKKKIVKKQKIGQKDIKSKAKKSSSSSKCSCKLERGLFSKKGKNNIYANRNYSMQMGIVTKGSGFDYFSSQTLSKQDSQEYVQSLARTAGKHNIEDTQRVHHKKHRSTITNENVVGLFCPHHVTEKEQLTSEIPSNDLYDTNLQVTTSTQYVEKPQCIRFGLFSDRASQYIPYTVSTETHTTQTHNSSLYHNFTRTKNRKQRRHEVKSTQKYYKSRHEPSKISLTQPRNTRKCTPRKIEPQTSTCKSSQKSTPRKIEPQTCACKSSQKSMPANVEPHTCTCKSTPSKVVPKTSTCKMSPERKPKKIEPKTKKSPKRTPIKIEPKTSSCKTSCTEKVNVPQKVKCQYINRPANCRCRYTDCYGTRQRRAIDCTCAIKMQLSRRREYDPPPACRCTRTPYPCAHQAYRVTSEEESNKAIQYCVQKTQTKSIQGPSKRCQTRPRHIRKCTPRKIESKTSTCKTSCSVPQKVKCRYISRPANCRCRYTDCYGTRQRRAIDCTCATKMQLSRRKEYDTPPCCCTRTSYSCAHQAYPITSEEESNEAIQNSLQKTHMSNTSLRELSEKSQNRLHAIQKSKTVEQKTKTCKNCTNKQNAFLKRKVSDIRRECNCLTNDLPKSSPQQQLHHLSSDATDMINDLSNVCLTKDLPESLPQQQLHHLSSDTTDLRNFCQDYFNLSTNKDSNSPQINYSSFEKSLRSSSNAKLKLMESGHGCSCVTKRPNIPTLSSRISESPLLKSISSQISSFHSECNIVVKRFKNASLKTLNLSRDKKPTPITKKSHTRIQTEGASKHKSDSCDCKHCDLNATKQVNLTPKKVSYFEAKPTNECNCAHSVNITSPSQFHLNKCHQPSIASKLISKLFTRKSSKKSKCFKDSSVNATEFSNVVSHRLRENYSLTNNNQQDNNSVPAFGVNTSHFNPIRDQRLAFQAQQRNCNCSRDKSLSSNLPINEKVFQSSKSRTANKHLIKTPSRPFFPKHPNNQTSTCHTRLKQPFDHASRNGNNRQSSLILFPVRSKASSRFSYKKSSSITINSKKDTFPSLSGRKPKQPHSPNLMHNKCQCLGEKSPNFKQAIKKKGTFKNEKQQFNKKSKLFSQRMTKETDAQPELLKHLLKLQQKRSQQKTKTQPATTQTAIQSEVLKILNLAKQGKCSCLTEEMNEHPEILGKMASCIYTQPKMKEISPYKYKEPKFSREFGTQPTPVGDRLRERGVITDYLQKTNVGTDVQSGLLDVDAQQKMTKQEHVDTTEAITKELERQINLVESRSPHQQRDIHTQTIRKPPQHPLEPFLPVPVLPRSYGCEQNQRLDVLKLEHASTHMQLKLPKISEAAEMQTEPPARKHKWIKDQKQLEHLRKIEQIELQRNFDVQLNPLHRSSTEQKETINSQTPLKQMYPLSVYQMSYDVRQPILNIDQQEKVTDFYRYHDKLVRRAAQNQRHTVKQQRQFGPQQYLSPYPLTNKVGSCLNLSESTKCRSYSKGNSYIGQNVVQRGEVNKENAKLKNNLKKQTKAKEPVHGKQIGTDSPDHQEPYPDFNRVMMRYSDNKLSPTASRPPLPLPAEYSSANYYATPPPNYEQSPCFTNPLNPCGPKICDDESALRRAYKRRPLVVPAPLKTKEQIEKEKKQEREKRKCEMKKKKAAAKKALKVKKELAKKKKSKTGICACIYGAIKDAEKNAFPTRVTCHPLYIHTLKKRPCWWVYQCFPSCYPCCLNFLRCQKNLCKIFLCCMAMCFWCPCLICMYICCTLVCRDG